MNTIWIILLVIISLPVIILVAALFAKRDFTVKREIVVNSSRNEVFNYIKYLKNHQAFSKWTTKEAGKKTESKGTDGRVGFVQTWDNFKERAGIGELEIKKITEGSELLLEHRYFKPLKGLASTLIITEQVSQNQAKVKWVYHGISNYPINLLTSVMNMDKIVGKDLDNCLVKLKSVIELKESNRG